MGVGKNWWRIPFHRPSIDWKPERKKPPKEFVCSISMSLMADPVIVASGQTFDHNCVQVCKNLGFSLILSDGSRPDFSTVIPNMAIKSTILDLCDTYGVERPKPLEFIVAESLVRALMASQKEKLELQMQSSNKKEGEEEEEGEVAEKKKRSEKLYLGLNKANRVVESGIIGGAVVI